MNDNLFAELIESVREGGTILRGGGFRRANLSLREQAMKTVTPAELSANTDQILDEVLESALPVEIVMGSRQLRIVVAWKTPTNSRT